jgi:hypothetical protein
MKCVNDHGQCGIGGNCTNCPDTVLDRAINAFTQAQLLAMPEVTDHYELVKYGLIAALREYGIGVEE